MKLAKEAVETEERMEQRRGNVLLRGIKSYLRAWVSVWRWATRPQRLNRTFGDKEAGSSFDAPQPPVKDVLPEPITTPLVPLENPIVETSLTIPMQIVETSHDSAFSWHAVYVLV